MNDLSIVYPFLKHGHNLHILGIYFLSSSRTWCQFLRKVSITLILEKKEMRYINKCYQKSALWNYTQIRPIGAGLCREERRTDRTKLLVALPNFESAQEIKNWQYSPLRALAFFWRLCALFLTSALDVGERSMCETRRWAS